MEIQVFVCVICVDFEVKIFINKTEGLFLARRTPFLKFLRTKMASNTLKFKAIPTARLPAEGSNVTAELFAGVVQGLHKSEHATTLSQAILGLRPYHGKFKINYNVLVDLMREGSSLIPYVGWLGGCETAEKDTVSCRQAASLVLHALVDWWPSPNPVGWIKGGCARLGDLLVLICKLAGDGGKVVAWRSARPIEGELEVKSDKSTLKLPVAGRVSDESKECHGAIAFVPRLPRVDFFPSSINMYHMEAIDLFSCIYGAALTGHRADADSTMTPSSDNESMSVQIDSKDPTCASTVAWVSQVFNHCNRDGHYSEYKGIRVSRNVARYRSAIARFPGKAVKIAQWNRGKDENPDLCMVLQLVAASLEQRKVEVDYASDEFLEFVDVVWRKNPSANNLMDALCMACKVQGQDLLENIIDRLDSAHAKKK